jgi:hypothetical protein
VELYHAWPWSNMATEATAHLVGDVALKVQGVMFGTITLVKEVMWGGNVASICRGTLLNWWDECKSNNRAGCKFWKIVCAEVVCGLPSNIGVRRTIPEDELTFIMWALESDKSPFRLLDHNFAEHLFSDMAIAWATVLVLWPDTLPQDASFFATEQSD